MTANNGHVAQVRGLRVVVVVVVVAVVVVVVVVGEDGAGKGSISESQAGVAQGPPGQAHGFDAAAHTVVLKGWMVHVSSPVLVSAKVPNAARPAGLTECKLRKERNKAPEAVRLQRGTKRPPVAVAGTWPSSTSVAGADRTRPVSWLLPEFFGVHPHTKGARCFTGGHRRRTPSSPKGLLASRPRDARRPFGPDVESADQQAV